MRKLVHTFCVGLFATIIFIGCGKDEYSAFAHPDRGYFTNEAPPAAGDESHTGTNIVGGEHSGQSGILDPTTSVKSDKSYQAGNMDGEEDNRQKAWMYWVLTGIRESIDTGTVPHDMPDALKQIQDRNKIVVPDQSQELVNQIVKIYRRGLEADGTANKLRSSGLDIRTMPWGSGRSGFKEYGELGKQTNMPDYHEMLGSTDPESTLEQAIRFDEKNHMSPIQARDAAFHEASMKIDQLGASLDLLGKTPEDVHNAGRQHQDIPMPNFGTETKIEPYRRTSGAFGLRR